MRHRGGPATAAGRPGLFPGGCGARGPRRTSRSHGVGRGVRLTPRWLRCSPSRRPARRPGRSSSRSPRPRWPTARARLGRPAGRRRSGLTRDTLVPWGL